MKAAVVTTIVIVALIGFQGQSFADSLWLGNDTVGDVFQTSTTGAVLTDLSSLGITGIAWDANTGSLYFADRQGDFTKRSANGALVLESFTVASGDTGEDLAWDSRRDVLWRIVHTNVLQEIDPTTGTLVNSFNIPTADPILGTLGGLGIAYDSTRDELYVSFCSVGCSSLSQGLVDIVDPNTGTVSGPLFRTTGFATGGLGYDAATDTLWVGDETVVRNMSRTGAVLSSFNRPSPGGFVDGLEFVGTAVPEPGTVELLGSGIALLGLARFLRIARRKPHH
jgi:hypothetical protein